jgi:hypothetical protein
MRTAVSSAVLGLGALLQMDRVAPGQPLPAAYVLYLQVERT